MSRRRNLILLVASACYALFLLCPTFGPTHSAQLAPFISAAPPFFAGLPDKSGDNRSDLADLRREAGEALGQLQVRTAP